MKLWSTSPPAPAVPPPITAGRPIEIWAATEPVAPGQSVSVGYRVQPAGGDPAQEEVSARWQFNADGCSYWKAELPPRPRGTRLTWWLAGDSVDGPVRTDPRDTTVEPLLSLAIIWHYHQPLYRDLTAPGPRGSYRLPWVRLHALRDYYAKTALLLDHPGVRVTINVSPVLLWQLDDYAERGATDRALELTLADVDDLDRAARGELLGSFFEADWHQQIMPHPRYRELFARRRAGRRLARRDLRDLQMWFNLCWFARPFLEGAVPLCTGEVVDVRRFVDQEADFTPEDCAAMVAEQYKVLRAIIPLLRLLQQRGGIEVSVTPFYHPILPLLVDAEPAPVDLPGARTPPRFAWPADGASQLGSALQDFRARFGCSPEGVWPAEGAVSPETVALMADQGVRWLASDQGVLARSGEFGYRVDRPEVLARPYRTAEGPGRAAIFFRSADPSNRIGFRYQHVTDARAAIEDLLAALKQPFLAAAPAICDPVTTLVVDGENPWRGYAREGLPFLRTLYGRLADDGAIRTLTPARFLAGDAAAGIRPHPVEELALVHRLARGSWIDEAGSAAGVDLGTWVGEAQENAAWRLLVAARAALAGSGKSPADAPAAWQAMYAAEGSDWFWWLGADQNSGRDELWDDLFRTHLRAVYLGAGLPPPPELDAHIVPHLAVFTFTGRLPRVQPGDRMAVRTHCPGRLHWRLDDAAEEITRLSPGVQRGGPLRFQALLGPFPAGSHRLALRFHCEQLGCDGQGECCRKEDVTLTIEPAAGRGRKG
jgi:alpha-amylase/alpha-mannosidase (GH57 family)